MILFGIIIQIKLVQEITDTIVIRYNDENRIETTSIEDLSASFVFY